MDITTTPGHGADPLLVVANTRHGPGGHYHARPGANEAEHDHLRDGRDAYAFLVDHGVRPDAAPPDSDTLAVLREIRELVRSLAGDPAPHEADRRDAPVARGPSVDEVALEALVAGRLYRLNVQGEPQPVSAGWAGFVDGLVPAVLELHQRPDRVRACANPACRFVFVDRSRNRSRLWCESAFCGNRIRVGRHRHRFSSPGPKPDVAPLARDQA
jgi:predicted RNA-binding Zn ribbon-like protein